MTTATTTESPDAKYIKFNPFEGEDADIKCRTVAIRKARKQHTCFTLNGKQDHTIEPGERYRHERAMVDGSFWGEYRICLRCIDQAIAEFEIEDDEDD